MPQAEGSDAGRPHARWRKPAVWQLIHDNIYTHRAPKEQDEDDIMICHCRPCYAGGIGCGPDCLNRVLNMECVPVRGRRSCPMLPRGASLPQSCAAPWETRPVRGLCVPGRCGSCCAWRAAARHPGRTCALLCRAQPSQQPA